MWGKIINFQNMFWLNQIPELIYAFWGILVIIFCCFTLRLWSNRFSKDFCNVTCTTLAQDDSLDSSFSSMTKEKPSNKSYHTKLKRRMKPLQAKENILQHSLLLCTLKAFSRQVTCVAVNSTGTKILAVSTDSTFRIFSMDPETEQSLEASAHTQSYIRGTIDSDYLTVADFSYDDNYIFGALALSGRLIKIELRPNTQGRDVVKSIVESSQSFHKNTLRWLSSSKGNYIITASEGDDTEIFILNYFFEKLSVVNTKQVQNYQLAVSPNNGQFFGMGAWTSGLKVMEVHTGKTKDYKKVEKAFDIPTSCGVTAVAFSPDNTRLVVVCKDGSVLLWNINIRYKAKEDPKLLLSTKIINEIIYIDHLGQSLKQHIPGFNYLSFSGDGKTIIGVYSKSIKLLSATNLNVITVIEDAYSTPIISLSSSSYGNYFVTAAMGDHRPRVWKIPNPSSII